MLAIMQRYKFVPEAYNLNTKKVEKGLGQYPLRPEVAESLFYLYQATGKEQYRDAGRVMVRLHFAIVNLLKRTRSPLTDRQSEYICAHALWLCCG
jgi:hypothetical protein